jgi:hypothetical protein
VSRPETPPLVVGYDLLMYSGTPGRRNGKSWSPVKVVTVGRKYVHVIGAEDFDRYQAEPDKWRWRVRRFLMRDMREGEPGSRVGYTAALATEEQRAYDGLLDRSLSLLRDRAGIDFRYGTPFDYRHHPERVVELADAVAALLDGYPSVPADE